MFWADHHYTIMKSINRSFVYVFYLVWYNTDVITSVNKFPVYLSADSPSISYDEYI